MLIGPRSASLQNHSGSSPNRLVLVLAPWLKVPFTRRPPSVYFKEGSLHSRMVTQAFSSERSLRLIPDWATTLQKAHPQSGNCHPYSRVGNYYLKGSSQLGNNHASSPIGQLPSGRFIPDWDTASLFVF